jgi:hypothetical protein
LIVLKQTDTDIASAAKEAANTPRLVVMVYIEASISLVRARTDRTDTALSLQHRVVVLDGHPVLLDVLFSGSLVQSFAVPFCVISLFEIVARPAVTTQLPCGFVVPVELREWKSKLAGRTPLRD